MSCRFDLFVNNQNIAAELPHTWWSTTFRDSIKHIGCVLLVMAPWSNPIPLTRAWCLYEVLNSCPVTSVCQCCAVYGQLQQTNNSNHPTHLPNVHRLCLR